MRAHIAMAIAAVLVLGGCTDADWDHLTRFSNNDDTPSQPAMAARQNVAAPMPAAASQPNEFCQAAARQDAGDNAFDAATQASIFARSYQQCVALSGATPR